MLLPRLGAVRVSAYSCVLAVPMLVGASAMAGEPSSWRMPTGTEGLVLAHLGVVLTAGGFWCWFRGIQLAGVEQGSLTVGLLPPAAVVAMTMQDHVVPPATQMAGICVVVVGLLVGVSTPAHTLRRTRPVALPDGPLAAVGTAVVADSSMSTTATAIPSAASRRAVAAPMPRAAPVTMATRGSSDMITSR
jgi:hypothetical protein